MFTKIKDVDLKILSNLDDRDLLNACATNKYAKRICNDESFWRNRFVGKYGEMAAKYKPVGRTWKNHYMQIIIDLDRFREEPMQFLNLIRWDKRGIDYSYFVENGKSIPFREAPEWVMANFWLLNLGTVNLFPIKINLHHVAYYDTYQNLTPHQLLQKLDANIRKFDSTIFKPSIKQDPVRVYIAYTF